MTQASKQAVKVEQKPCTELSKQITLVDRVEAVVKAASGLKVTTAVESVKASETLREAAKLRREIEAKFKELRAPLIKRQKEIIAKEQVLTNTLDAAEKILSGMIRSFQQKEAAERAEREQKEREAREKAARDEARLRADQLRAAAAQATSKSIVKRLEHQANVIESAAPIIEPVEVEDKPTTLAAGVHERKNVRAAVDDPSKLLLQCAAQAMLAQFGGAADAGVRAFLSTFKPNPQASLNLMTPHMVNINKLATALPDDLALEGVRVESDSTFVAR